MQPPCSQTSWALQNWPMLSPAQSPFALQTLAHSVFMDAQPPAGPHAVHTVVSVRPVVREPSAKLAGKVSHAGVATMSWSTAFSSSTSACTPAGISVQEVVPMPQDAPRR